VPAWQVVPLAQRFPQAPQFELSVCSSTHAVPQAERPPVQVSVHLPAVQSCAPTHSVPQVPQLFGSIERSTHTPPQDVCPAGQAHLPATQLVPPLQATPQPPQF
jgi:hypothetical protein